MSTDLILWLLTICATVYSCLIINSMQRAGEYNFMKTQLMAVFAGYIGALIISVIDYEYITNLWWFISLLGLGLLIIVFPLGIRVEGTGDFSWIRLPGGITFQPSELVKILFILTFSKHLSYLSEKNRITNFSSLIFLTIHAAVPMIIIHLQGDDGAVMIFAFMFTVMSFAAGVKARYFIIMITLLIASFPFLWFFIFDEYQQNRILALFDIDGSATSYGWQQYQGKVSIASGQLTGAGLYKGPRVEYELVPEQENDFIFTVAGEELGFIGCVLIVLLLLFIILKIMSNSKKSRDSAGTYICFGVFTLIASQTILNLGMVLTFLPVVGVVLPFFSSGGTSAMCLYLGIGLVQSVYMHQENIDIAKVKLNKMNRRKI